MRRIVFLALVAVVAAAAAAPATGHGKPDVTITFVARNHERAVHDLGPAGASQGDIRVSTAELFNRRGQRIGRVAASCVLVEAGDDPQEKVLANCTVTLRFAGGELFGGGLSDFERFHDVLRMSPGDVHAITGGTGVYEGMYGTVRWEAGRGVVHLHGR